MVNLRQYSILVGLDKVTTIGDSVRLKVKHVVDNMVGSTVGPS